MARRVFFHVGTLKTGTTYLQRLMWENRAALRSAGVLIPGEVFQDRVWATQTVRGMAQPHARAAGAWDRIVGQVNAFEHDAVISHEFFAAATEQQVARAIGRVAPAEVHVIVTTRDLIGILPAFWQERLKFGYTGGFADYDPDPLDAQPSQHWSWRTIDAADVLRRWGADLAPERVHVVTLPRPGAPRDLLWRRFAHVCGIDPDVATLDLPRVNESMGVAEAELLRRVNHGLHPQLRRPTEPARWVRSYLGQEILARRDGEPLRVAPERAAELRQRGKQIAEEIRARGYDVVGDLDDIVGPEAPPTSRLPGDVPDTELLEVAVDVINVMLADHRRISRENDELRRRGDVPLPVAAPRRSVRSILRAIRRRLPARNRHAASSSG
jgi:hypothetical protein